MMGKCLFPRAAREAANAEAEDRGGDNQKGPQGVNVEWDGNGTHNLKNIM
jgi:hypothetical protein